MERIEINHQTKRATRLLANGVALAIPYPDAIVRIQRGLAREVPVKRGVAA